MQELSPGKDIGLQFCVITKTKEPIVERHTLRFAPLRVERAKRTVERVWSAIESGIFYPAPSPLTCGGCPFRDACHNWSG